MFKQLPRHIKIVEVGPRDGLQNEKTILSPEIKFQYIKNLIDAGIKNIEVTSFVKAGAIPQMGDAEELWKKVKTLAEYQSIHFLALVPNMIGFEKAQSLGVKEIALFSATSNSFTKKNINCSVDESFIRMSEVANEAHKNKIKIRAYISTAFGCPYEGLKSKEELLEVIKKFQKLNVDEISIGDTIGVATPKQVDEYLEFLKPHIDLQTTALHMHDTHGMALTNILVGLMHGISIFDSSSGGLGGCPYAQGATGNVATEDVVYLAESMGIKTDIDFKKLADASVYILNEIKKTTGSKHLEAFLRSKT